MENKLDKYKSKRNFKITSEPKGKIKRTKDKLIFCVQHHASRKEHYDFRLELNGVLLSFAIPKGPSYNPDVKRLAVHVENHPYEYRNFEGVIPKNEYGAGIVGLWDKGTWEPLEDPNRTFPKGYLKFILNGKRLKGKWAMVYFKDNNWLIIKEKDEYIQNKDISLYKRSVKTNRTMSEIGKNKSVSELEKINITSPDKLLYKKAKITKQEVVDYYKKVEKHMLPYIKNRIVSTVRCPNGVEEGSFFKKHLETKDSGIKKILLPNKTKRNDYYYITSSSGLISEIQMNSIEFHIWGSNVNDIDYPNMMVFDLDPDETLEISKVREGVKDLKKILDELELKSYLKTSGGKGYHVVVPIKVKIKWQEFRSIAKNIAELMEKKWPEKYTSNIRKDKRKGKIFIDWLRNTKGSTSVAPYSLRVKENASVSMPIKWSELDKIKPNEITIKDAIKRLKRKNPWEDYFN